MNPRLNPSEDRLLAYAAGSLSAPEAVVVAAHLAMRPANDAWVRQLQAVGGEFLDEAPAAALSNDALALAMARIETDAGEVRPLAPLNGQRPSGITMISPCLSSVSSLAVPPRDSTMNRTCWRSIDERVRKATAPRSSRPTPGFRPRAKAARSSWRTGAWASRS